MFEIILFWIVYFGLIYYISGDAEFTKGAFLFSLGILLPLVPIMPMFGIITDPTWAFVYIVTIIFLPTIILSFVK